jgi:hypothetical protein
MSRMRDGGTPSSAQAVVYQLKGWGFAPALFGPVGYDYKSDMKIRPTRVAKGIKPPQSILLRLRIFFIVFSFMIGLSVFYPSGENTEELRRKFHRFIDNVP